MLEDPRQTLDRTALITGASSGIGAAFAKVYAERGYHLALHAPPWEETNLRELSHNLERTYAVKTHILIADLSDPLAPIKMQGELSEMKVIVDVLINNAGFGQYSDFTEQDWSDHQKFLHVMVLAPVNLAHIYAPSMARNGYGRIINVASVTALFPGLPRLALYGAAKAFMISFSEAIATELAPDGVHVTALCPGATRTGIFADSKLEKKLKYLPDCFWMDTETVARQGYEAVENGVPIHVTGRINRAITLMVKYMPDWILRKYLRKRSDKIRRKQREPR